MPWMHNLAIVYRIEIVTSYHTLSAPSCRHYAVKYFFPTDDEGCEDATELPLQNVITKENELLKKETTRAVQHVALLNCDHPSSSGSTADPDKNSAVSDFYFAVYRVDARYANVLNPYHTTSN